jgi:hypothetical protein
LKAKKKKTENYVDNQRLYEALVEHRQQTPDAEGFRKISNEIGDAISKICHGLSLAHNFRNYSYRDEMVDDAVENVIYAVKFFDPAKSKNPFGYFTLVAYRAFIRRIQIEQKENYLKHKNFEKQFIESGGVGQGPNEYSREVIEKFEERMERNKRKSKEAGLLKIAQQEADDERLRSEANKADQGELPEPDSR